MRGGNLTPARMRTLSQAIFLCLELSDSESPKAHVLRYLDTISSAFVSSLCDDLYSDALVSVVLDNKDIFPTKFRSVPTMNRMRENQLPQEEWLKSHVTSMMARERERRLGTINLNEILDVFDRHPEKYIEVKANTHMFRRRERERKRKLCSG
jgi:hypothetical protein